MFLLFFTSPKSAYVFFVLLISCGLIYAIDFFQLLRVHSVRVLARDTL